MDSAVAARNVARNEDVFAPTREEQINEIVKMPRLKIDPIARICAIVHAGYEQRT
jgi:hypothetical protein